MSKEKFIEKYYDTFDVYGKGGITFDELVAELMLIEGIIDIKEYHEILEGLTVKLGHPKFIELHNKYKAIFKHYNRGLCSLQELYEAIEVLEKFYKNKRLDF